MLLLLPSIRSRYPATCCSRKYPTSIPCKRAGLFELFLCGALHTTEARSPFAMVSPLLAEMQTRSSRVQQEGAARSQEEPALGIANLAYSCARAASYALASNVHGMAMTHAAM